MKTDLESGSDIFRSYRLDPVARQYDCRHNPQTDQIDGMRNAEAVCAADTGLPGGKAKQNELFEALKRSWTDGMPPELQSLEMYEDL
jgi:hypothetical protein